MRKRVGRSRLGVWLLAVAVAVFAMIRRFRFASPPSEPCAPPVVDDSPPAQPTTVASRIRRSGLLIGVGVPLLAVSIGMGCIAWGQYAIATVQPPRLTSEGSVTVYVPPDVQGVEPKAVVAQMNLTPDRYSMRLFLQIHPRVWRSACVPYVVSLYGSARLASPEPRLIDQGVVIEGNTWRRTAEELLVRGSACPGRSADGQDPGRLYGSVGWPLAGPTVIQQGSWTALAIPSLAVRTGDREDFSAMVRDFDSGSPHGLGTTYSADAECTVDLGPLGPVDRLEAAAPPLDGPGLRWLTCEKPMTALLVSIPLKADADRALFWAGLSGGLAFSLLLFILQLIVQALLDS
ncbi:hypothetical protein HS041_29310 [Planomonospora sp. ID67723]|uniref:hypothetical protein n=1 Tax=Planomonospora sp. ID67723 TaxID=2738134 RepID=UPI0018C3C46B|nr:hypothetical protein [Planomonospora sp. ID67723]MBG0831819.1 hypothetical protein [Planomonospora sp. ID67723]